MNPASAGFAHDGRWNARAPGTDTWLGPTTTSGRPRASAKTFSCSARGAF